MSFDKEFLNQIKSQLLEDKEHIEKELLPDNTIKTSKGNETAFPDYGDHAGENASEVASFDSDLSTSNILRSKLRDIDSTIKKIDKGEYGICKYCGKEMTPDRLKARPTSSSCVECKSKFSN